MDLWLAVPVLLSALALIGGGLDKLSAITGGIIGYMVLFTGGWRWLSLLILFFTLGTIATNYKYATKSKYHLSQKKRSVENVLGNGLVPLIFALQGNLVGFAASLASVTADTVSSEIGVLSKGQPVSILDLKTEVKRGTNGGVSLLGNVMTLIGSGAVALGVFLLFGDVKIGWMTFWAGAFGCVTDSVLGATLENDGVVGNHMVNLLSSLSAGIVAVWLFSLF